MGKKHVSYRYYISTCLPPFRVRFRLSVAASKSTCNIATRDVFAEPDNESFHDDTMYYNGE